MQSDSYVVIQGWMCNELELKGNDLLVFALIHGFSQDGESKFSGSRKYIAETFNISLPTVDKAIKNLLEKELIEQHKEERNGITFNSYNSLYPVKNLYRGSKESLHNNINNTIENINNNSKELLLQKTPNFEFGKRKIVKSKKENMYSKCVNLIIAKTDKFEERQLLINWLDMLLEKYKLRGKQLYVNVFKGKLRMLDKYDENDWKEIIEYNLQKGYEGFYPIPVYSGRTKNVMKDIEGMEHVEAMTKEDYEELEKLIEERRKNGLRTSF